MAALSRRCSCPGVTPETCITDDEWLSQYGRVNQLWRVMPKEGELEISLMRGQLTLTEIVPVILGRRAKPEHFADGMVRHVRVGNLRAIGVDVVHTAGLVKNGRHTSAVWPMLEEWGAQVGQWPADLQDKFDQAFN